MDRLWIELWIEKIERKKESTFFFEFFWFFPSIFGQKNGLPPYLGLKAPKTIKGLKKHQNNPKTTPKKPISKMPKMTQKCQKRPQNGPKRCPQLSPGVGGGGTPVGLHPPHPPGPPPPFGDIPTHARSLQGRSCLTKTITFPIPRHTPSPCGISLPHRRK